MLLSNWLFYSAVTEHIPCDWRLVALLLLEQAIQSLRDYKCNLLWGLMYARGR